jgi:hypothetical protein
MKFDSETKVWGLHFGRERYLRETLIMDLKLPKSGFRSVKKTSKISYIIVAIDYLKKIIF